MNYQQANVSDLLKFNILSKSNLINKNILLYGSIIILPVGIGLNLIAYLIFKRKSLNSSGNTMGFYYSTLALINIISLGSGIVMYLPTALGSDLRVMNHFFCKLLWFLRRVITTASSWFQVLITIDRTLTVIYPGRFALLRKKSNISAIVALMFASLAAIMFGNIFYFVEDANLNSNSSMHFIEIEKDFYLNETFLFILNGSGKKRCVCSAVVAFLTDILTALLRAIFPFTIMFFCNMIISKKLINSKLNALSQRSRFSTKEDRSLRKAYQFASTITTLNWIFFILNLPSAFGLIMRNIDTYVLKSASEEFSAILQTIYNLGVMLSFLNQALLFLISLRYNPSFKREFKIAIRIHQPTELASNNYSNNCSNKK
jgi:hypothetical protein